MDYLYLNQYNFLAGVLLQPESGVDAVDEFLSEATPLYGAGGGGTATGLTGVCVPYNR